MKWTWKKFRVKKINWLPFFFFLLLFWLPFFLQLGVTKAEREEQRYYDALFSYQELVKKTPSKEQEHAYETRLKWYEIRVEALKKGDFLRAQEAQEWIEQEEYQGLLAAGVQGERLNQKKLRVAKLAFYNEQKEQLIEPETTPILPLVEYSMAFIEQIPFWVILGIGLVFLSKYDTDEDSEKTKSWLTLVPVTISRQLFERTFLYLAWILGAFGSAVFLFSGSYLLFFGMGRTKLPLFFISTHQEIIERPFFTYFLAVFLGTGVLLCVLGMLIAVFSYVFETFPLTLATSALLLGGIWLLLPASKNLLNVPLYAVEHSVNQTIMSYLILFLISLLSFILFSRCIQVPLGKLKNDESNKKQKERV